MQHPANGNASQRDASEIRRIVCAIWDDLLHCGQIADDVTFFEAGGTSMTLVTARSRMQKALGVELDMTQMFETPRLGDLARAIADQVGRTPDAPPQSSKRRKTEEINDERAIAIIGYAARLPGAETSAEFWKYIQNGDNLIDRFEPSELEDTHGADIRSDPNYVPARSVLQDVDQFDAKYFGILPTEADQMDPQARIFLELCAQALEDAAVDVAREGKSIGVYAGATHSTYLHNNVLRDRKAVDGFTSGFQLENYNAFTGNIADTLATRVAFKLNLKGPAISVSTTCSTSLTAIAQAVTALRAGQCEAALAGGVSITFPQNRGYVAKEGGMASADGLCRPFDKDAGGTVFGHGAGVLVLKTLSKAVRDKDRILGVIKGVGINNDGADKIAFTAPSVQGQAEAIAMAHKDADINPSSISYIECHGTATPLGDPIEIRGLTEAFGGAAASGSIAVGSVKGNVGHLDAAAGVVSAIKVLEMFRAREIPPVAHFKSPNPRIDFEGGPFFVPDGGLSWTGTGPLRAGVSGFGVGGTNVHLVLEEAPEPAVCDADKVDDLQILPLSAKTSEALGIAVQNLAAALEADTGLVLADVANTLQNGRQQHAFRFAVAARSKSSAIAALQSKPSAPRRASDTVPVCFMFPGQGAQYPGMAAGLYAKNQVFRHVIDAGFDVLRAQFGSDDRLRDLLVGEDRSSEAAEALRQTSRAQPALFLVSYAMAKLWREKGITPTHMLGHSVGEFVAAALADIMSFEDALTLVAKRGALMQAQPPGAMLSVRASLEAIEPYLGIVDLAAANAPKLQVLSGPEEVIGELEAKLSGAGLMHRRLHTSHAFHSSMMDAVGDGLLEVIRTVSLYPPQIEIISTVTGKALSADKATDPAYWAGQARASVRFADALESVADTSSGMLLEVGPGNALSTFVTQTLKRDQYAGTTTSMPGADAQFDPSQKIAEAIGELWCAGVPIDWRKVTNAGHQKVALPGPVFMRKRHWVEPMASIATEDLKPVPPKPFVPTLATIPAQEAPSMSQSTPRIARLRTEVTQLFADLSGEELGLSELDIPFLELGFDSLFMGQASQAISKTYGVDMSFREMLSDHPTIGALSAHIDAVLPEDVTEKADEIEVAAPASLIGSQMANSPAAPSMNPSLRGDVAAVAQAQLLTMQNVFAEQMRALAGGQVAAPAAMHQPKPVAIAPQTETQSKPQAAKPKPNDEPVQGKSKAFKFGRGPNTSGADLNDVQLRFAEDLAQEYSAKFAGSKAHTQSYRKAHADPRSVAGFRPEWKELTFPIVAEKSKGAWIEDVDGNRFVDLVNGFGQTAFGHAPDFVSDAVKAQLEKGYALGPQADQAGPVAERFAKMVGHERVTFCNTGSEAVMAAMRLARAVTGREQVVVFSNDYHGQFDEVLVKGRTRGTNPAALPIAPGIPRAAVSNMVVLEYGADSTLDWINANGDDIAAVVVEPVQSRNPELRPADFVRALRDLTQENGAALVIDEVVTGFRTHAKGMQGVWDIQPDMATYGKVVGGGMPIGVLAGNARFMDALDGGYWTYADDSEPTVAPTFFAGTFVRHPLVVAAVDAVLDYLETQGDKLWVDSADRAKALANSMNAAMEQRGLPPLVKHYSSWFVIKTTQHDPRATLLYPLMRLQGVHLLDGFCGFLTTEHGDAECAKVLKAFEVALDRLQSVGILAAETETVKSPAAAQDIPLTEAQREIWMVHQLSDTAATSFNESVSLTIRGTLDHDLLFSSLNDVVARHDALRARFSKNGSSFRIAEGSAPTPEIIDLRGEANVDKALSAFLSKDAHRPVDLISGPPIRATLVRLKDDKHVFVLTAHHIVCDGWSFNTVINDLAAIYSARISQSDPDLAAAPSFAAYAQSDTTRTAKQETRDYWADILSNVPDLPDLPTDRPRTAQRSFNGNTVSIDIPADRIVRLKKAGGKLGATLYSTVLAGLQITLGRIAGSQEVVLCTPMGGQAQLDDQSLVGHLVNFLPIRADFDLEEAVGDHVKRAADAVMAAQDHSAYTLGTMVRDLNIPRHLNRLPISEVQYNLERVAENLKLGIAEAEMRGNPKAGVNYDLFFNCVEGPKGLRIEVDHNADLFDGSTVARWAQHLGSVLEAICESSATPIKNLPLLSAEEEKALAHQFNATEMGFNRQMTVHDLISAQVEKSPDQIAVTGSDRSLTYRELAERSDSVASHIQSQVSGSGQRIGVALPRDTELLVGLLGVLKAGHTYVPLDPSQPVERQRTVLKTAEAKAVLCPETAGLDLTLSSDCIVIDPSKAASGVTPNSTDISGDQAAYVIFTSGSTGTPKGVEIPHSAVVNFLLSMARQPGLTASDKLLSVTTVSFDIAVLELFLPLTVGAQVEIATREDVLDGFRLVERLEAGDITVMQATPTLWAMLLEAGLSLKPGLKLLAGGEPIAADLAERLLKGGVDLWNMYGPTETTIWSSVQRLQLGQPVTIGAPIANTQLHVLDANNQLCVPGQVGELNIGGDGLALGYLGQPDLTASAFRDVKIAGQHARLYKTGDLAIREADGHLRLLGRRDGQIKLRGFRIELGEIEARLRAHPSVSAAAVALAKGSSGIDQLAAYVVPQNNEDLDQDMLKRSLADQLPDYMVPTAWSVVKALPQTTNGKLDRKALPSLRTEGSAPKKAVDLPSGETETKIAAIWGTVLGLENTGVTATLFQLGTDSLGIFRLAARLMEAGFEIEARDVFANPSVRELAAHIDAAKPNKPKRPSLKDFTRTPRTGT